MFDFHIYIYCTRIGFDNNNIRFELCTTVPMSHERAPYTIIIIRIGDSSWRRIDGVLYFIDMHVAILMVSMCIVYRLELFIPHLHGHNLR